jgi:hypothetical protein
MIECIFTLDYEIYGNGKGSLAELVYEPAERLRTIFRRAGSRFVVFAEAAELEVIDVAGVDPDVDAVKRQIRSFHVEGFEIGLHLHPWWYNARRENGEWVLDYTEYNLCALPPERIAHMVDRSLAFLRKTLDVADFTPLAFRAGHLLFQPGEAAAKVLASRGIRLDSSVYKGGLWRQYKLDYRRAMDNGYYWKFSSDSNVPDPKGLLLELPIHTLMVPTWTMLTTKRVGLERKAASVAQTGRKLVARLRDSARLRRPLKFDYCAMTVGEMKAMLDRVIREDRKDPTAFRPLVAIGHTKDLVDYKAVEVLLEYLHENRVRISTFTDVYDRCPLTAPPRERVTA